MGKRGGSIFRTIGTLFWLIAIAGGVLGLLRVNNISNAEDLYNYAKGWSDYSDSCYGDGKDGEVWICEGKEPPANSSTDGNGGSSTETPEKPNSGEYNQILSQLNAIPTKPAAGVKYSRSEWKHWSDFDKNGCDTREEVLIRDGKNTKTDPKTCRVIAGEWFSIYDKKSFIESQSLDIDHIIPLNYAAQHGGNGWSAQQKEIFANDMSQLIAVSANSNRKKSDKGPSEYMPPNKAHWCDYSTTWVKTATKYKLWITEADKKVLRTGLESC